MITEYIICQCYPKYKYRNKINRNDTINEFLINKYKNKLTYNFNDKDILNVKFNKIEIDNCYYDLYITDNKDFIQFIRKIEKNNYELKNPYIFVKFEDKFKKYINFNVDNIININNNYQYKLTYNITFTNEYLNQVLHDDDFFPFVFALIDINKYYKDLILNNQDNNIIKNNIIENINNIIKYDFNEEEETDEYDEYDEDDEDDEEDDEEDDDE